MKPKISIIVPVYNPGSYLRECLDTLLNQTMKEIEIICVDDGSTDGSLYLLQHYAQKDNRIKVIHQENQGAGAARNAGLDAATADWLLFLDADDFFENDMLEYLYTVAQRDQSDVIECAHYAYDNRTKQDVQIKYPVMEAVEKSPFAPEEFSDILFYITYPGVCNKLFRTSLIRENQIRFSTVPQGEDLYFSCQALALSKKVSVCSIPFFHYRVENLAQSTSHVNKPKVASLFLEMMLSLYDKLKGWNLHQKFKKAYMDVLIKSLGYELSTGSNLQKRKTLKLIRSVLPAEITDEFFPSDKPAISLVLCVYNGEKYLDECLNSLIHQSLQNIEIICVDDASTDSSLKILQKFAAKDKRIKVLTHEKNQKLSIARRTAMKAVTGEYTLYVDADDYLELDACECLYLYSRVYSLDMCMFKALEFWDETREDFENPYHRLEWWPDRFVPIFSQENVKEVIHRIAVTSGLTLYRNSFLKENKIEWVNKPVFYEDTLFFTECLLRTQKAGVLPETFLHKRAHQDAITRHMENNFSDFCFVIERVWETVDKYGNSNMLYNYIGQYLYQGWSNYVQFNEALQQKYESEFLHLCDVAVMKYVASLPDFIVRWYEAKKNEKRY